MEERNVFCGTYNIRILCDMQVLWSESRSPGTPELPTRASEDSHDLRSLGKAVLPHLKPQPQTHMRSHLENRCLIFAPFLASGGGRSPLINFVYTDQAFTQFTGMKSFLKISLLFNSYFRSNISLLEKKSKKCQEVYRGKESSPTILSHRDDYH